MVITSKEHSSLDIWLKTPNQSASIEEMIFITWYNEAMKQSRINL